jgi:hypothetical protein
MQQENLADIRHKLSIIYKHIQLMHNKLKYQGKTYTISEKPVSILASFYDWTKSLICKDAANRDSTVQSEVRIISKFPVSRLDDVSSRPDAHLPTVPSVQTTCLSVRTSDRQASSIWTTCFFRPDTYIVSRSFGASLLCLDVSAARPDAYQFSNGSLILSKFKKGKINQPSGRCGIPSRRESP